MTTTTRTVTLPYELDEGVRIRSDPMELGPGLTSRIISTRAPLRAGRSKDLVALSPIPGGISSPESWLGVPILTGDRVIGVIVLESTDRDVFVEADERLLSTLAASMGVALENARLFDETKRLLAETDQRAAELAIINGVQQGLAAELDLQAMYDLVGDQVQAIVRRAGRRHRDRRFRRRPPPFRVHHRARRALPRRPTTDHGDHPRRRDGS